MSELERGPEHSPAERSPEETEALQSIGKAIRAIREARGLSLSGAATETGVPATVIGSYERGQRGISVARLLRLAAGYGVSPRSLLPNEGPPDPYAALKVLREFVDGYPSTAIPDARSEVARLSAQLAEILPYAWAGAEALSLREPYGPPPPAGWPKVDDPYRNDAGEVLARILAGEFGEVSR